MHRLASHLRFLIRKQQRKRLFQHNQRLIQTEPSPKLHHLTVNERRELFGLPTHIEPMLKQNIAKIPLGLSNYQTQFLTNSFYPLKQEEASVIAGATGMGKLVKPLNVKEHNNTLIIECIVPFNRLQKDDISGQKMAEGIFDIYHAARKDPLRAITNNKGIINATFPYLDALIPTSAIRATAMLLSHAIDSGIDFKTNTPSTDHWLSGTFVINQQRLLGE